MNYQHLPTWAPTNSKEFISRSPSPGDTPFEQLKCFRSDDSGVHLDSLDLIEAFPAIARFDNASMHGRSPFVISPSEQVFYSGIPSNGPSAYKAFCGLGQSASTNIASLKDGMELVNIPGSSVISCFGSKFFGFNMISAVALGNALNDCPANDLQLFFSSKIGIGSFFEGLISRLGIPFDNSALLSRDSFYWFERLWVPVIPISFMKKVPNTTSRLFFDNFRERLGIPEAFPRDKSLRRRIFISREDSSYRQVANESQITEALDKYSFTTIVASRLTLAERIDLLGQAEIVISAAGSNLFNCLFAPSGAQIGELIPDYYSVDEQNRNVLKTVILGCRQDYWRIVCDIIKQEDVRYSHWDFSVPVPHVTRAVERMLDNLGYGA